MEKPYRPRYCSLGGLVGIGGVDDLADECGEGEAGDDTLPVPALGVGDGGVFADRRALLERLQLAGTPSGQPEAPARCA